MTGETDAGDEIGGDTEVTDNTARVVIHRSPATETNALVRTRVRWRGEVWLISARVEMDNRTKYELTLERTV